MNERTAMDAQPLARLGVDDALPGFKDERGFNAGQASPLLEPMEGQRQETNTPISARLGLIDARMLIAAQA